MRDVDYLIIALDISINKIEKSINENKENSDTISNYGWLKSNFERIQANLEYEKTSNVS